MKFLDKTVIVTGGTRGIGKAISLAFLKEGANVVATYGKNHQAADLFRDEAKLYENKLQLCCFDASDERAIHQFFDEREAQSLEAQILINNCGTREDALLAQMEKQSWDRVLETNLTSTFLMAKRAVLHFLPQRWGRIVNISSIGGKLGLPGQANYAASKAGQLALSKSLSKEVARKNITVNSLLPGFIQTDLLDGLPEDLIKDYRKQVPMRRFGLPEEVAAAVLFLCSNEASYITGAELEISGGL